MMTNQGEVEKNELMNAEHNYDMDQNTFAPTSRLYVKYPSKTRSRISLKIQQLNKFNGVTPTGNMGSKIMHGSNNPKRFFLHLLSILSNGLFSFLSYLKITCLVSLQLETFGITYWPFNCSCKGLCTHNRCNSVLHSCSEKKKDCQKMENRLFTQKKRFIFSQHPFHGSILDLTSVIVLECQEKVISAKWYHNNQSRYCALEHGT